MSHYGDSTTHTSAIPPPQTRRPDHLPQPRPIRETLEEGVEKLPARPGDEGTAKRYNSCHHAHGSHALRLSTANPAPTGSGVGGG